MILFNDKKDCCGCGACFQACPKKAISFKTDECGFKYPEINDELCINCGLCKKVCAYQNIIEKNTPQIVYAATSNNDIQKKKSASGGIFAAIASYVIEKGGYVCGAAMLHNDDKFIIKHIIIDNQDDLKLLQGSKYVQSDTGICFVKIKELLNNGKFVLFSGTPCQCAGLKGYLRKDYDNLWITDIICHGVPNAQFFNDYINHSFGQLKNISGFYFRDKTKGWELAGKIIYENGSKVIYPPLSSYYSLFLKSHTYRINCYSCKYASEHRPGDITLGDYWGIQKEHPELLKSGIFSIKAGISCIIVNSEKGKIIIDSVSDYLSLSKSTYEKVSRQNKQLTEPSKLHPMRNDVMTIYQTAGYKGVDELYKKTYKTQRAIQFVFCHLPYWLKTLIRKLK